MNEEPNLSRRLEQALATVAHQAMEIDELRARAEQGGTVPALRDVLALSDVLNAVIGDAPYRALLNGIVRAAARLFDARASSIALVDRETSELVFEAASDDPDIVGMRFPATSGIAGWVVVTGEAIAVSDVHNDARFAVEVAEASGYVPDTILAVPLIVGDQVEGVLEVLDKRNSQTFNVTDMDLLSLFAEPAAVAVEQARTVKLMGSLILQELERLASEGGEQELAEDVQKAVLQGSAAGESMLELAMLVHAIGGQGDRTVQHAIEMLSSIRRFGGVRPR
jgi:GAF domain-containing protein